jgi:carboxypeptidase M
VLAISVFSVETTKHLKSFVQLFLVSSQVTVPGHDPHLTKIVIPEKSQNFSAFKKDFIFPLRRQSVSVLVSNPSCPLVPLYRAMPSYSAATKPSLFLFLVPLLHMFFK